MNSPPASGIHVLVAEDGEDIRILYEKVLNIPGRISVTCCSTPTEAVQLLESRTFDVLMTDLMFAGFSPEEVGMFLIKANGMDVGILICSAGSWKERPEVPNVIFLQKGAMRNEIITALEKAATNRRTGVCLQTGELQQLARPEEHHELPILRWERQVHGGHGTHEEELALYRYYISNELSYAAAHAEQFSKRELNDLMDKYVRISRGTGSTMAVPGGPQPKKRRMELQRAGTISLRV